MTETIDSSPKMDRCGLRGQVLVTSYVAVIGPVASATVLRNIVKNPITSKKYTVLHNDQSVQTVRFHNLPVRFLRCVLFGFITVRFMLVPVSSSPPDFWNDPTGSATMFNWSQRT